MPRHLQRSASGAWRRQVPALSSAQAARRRRLARSQDRARLLHLRRPGQEGAALMDFELITVDIADRVALLTINRPESLNALSPELLTEMSIAVAEIELHDEASV